jgi:hypothetical protein
LHYQKWWLANVHYHCGRWVGNHYRECNAPLTRP